MTTNLPKVIVVGDPRLGTMLATCGAQWLIQPVAPTVTAMWDSIDNGQLDADVAAIIFTDGTGTTPDELELSLLSFSSYCHTFLFADPVRAKTIIDRARQLAPNVPNSDPNAPIWALPVLDANKAIQTIQQITEPNIQWSTPASAPTPTPAPPAPPAPQPVAYTNPVPPAPTTTQPFAPQPNQTYTPQTSPKNYDQAQAYGDHIVEQAQHSIPKLPNAIPGQMTIACMSSKGGSGKCLQFSSKILDTRTGLRHTIEDVVTNPEITHAFGFDNRFISPNLIGDKIYSGKKETFTVMLQSGRTISATGNHPFLTTDGWRTLESLKIGETLATPSRIPFPSNPQHLPEEELDLLSVIMAEGGTTGRATNFTSNDVSIVEIVAKAAIQAGITMADRDYHPMQYSISGILPVETHPDECSCGCGSPAAQVVQVGETNEKGYRHWATPDHWLRRFRRVHKLEGTRAKDKTMPDAVFRLPEEQLGRFLAVFWMCDGYVSAKGGGDVGVTLASEELVEAFQHLLLRFGIQSTLKYKLAKAGGKEFDAWRLTVHASSFPAFQAHVPVWGEKADNLQKLIDRSAKNGSNPNLGCPTFSDDLYKELYGLAYPGLTREVCDELGWNVKTHVSPSMVLRHRKTRKTGLHHLNLNGLRLWAEKTGSEDKYGWIYDSEIFWDEIVSIESDGIQRVYDLEIPSVHNFIADDIIVHNSTTALCLAGTIARATAAANNPKKVVLVDLDTRDGQVGSLIGLFMPTALNIRVLPIRDAASVKANLVHDKKMGIDALLAPVRPRNADDVGPEFYRDVIGILQTTHDIVILDCSVNYLDPLLGVGFAMSDEILFVTTLATTSVQGMARSLTELFADPSDGGLGIPREKVGIVANQVINNVGMGRDKLLKAALGAPLIGQIPSDQDAVLIATNSTKMYELLRHPRLGPAYYKLAQACLPGVPMVPLTAESAAVQQAGQPDQQGKRRLFGR